MLQIELIEQEVFRVIGALKTSRLQDPQLELEQNTVLWAELGQFVSLAFRVLKTMDSREIQRLAAEVEKEYEQR